MNDAIYISSKGEEKKISEMNFPNIIHAIAKVTERMCATEDTDAIDALLLIQKNLKAEAIKRYADAVNPPQE
jgi:predicted nuclease of predicted toxin-antitoxin system